MEFFRTFGFWDAVFGVRHDGASDEAYVWSGLCLKRKTLRAWAAQEGLQGVRRCEHLHAWVAQEHVHRVRRCGHLHAWAAQELLQGVWWCEHLRAWAGEEQKVPWSAMDTQTWTTEPVVVYVEGGASEASGAHLAWLMLCCLWNRFLHRNTMHFKPNTVPGPSPRRPNAVSVIITNMPYQA